MTNLASKLEEFRTGTTWKAKYGRLSLPVLVSWAERYKGRLNIDIPDFTYSDLAWKVATRKYAHPMQHALGSVGYALNALAAQPNWQYGAIPHIQLLVWSKGAGSPGEDAFGFLGISRAQADAMGKPGRHMVALDYRSKILAYPHWREVLAALGLKPVTLELPTVAEVLNSPNPDRGGGPESEHHRRMKRYLASHYDVLGIKGQFTAHMEAPLMSGDQADLLLHHVLGRRRVCVEVKSRISPEGDLIRGIFQCVKYQSVLEAEEKYISASDEGKVARQIQVLLATEMELSPRLRELCGILHVKAVTVKIPKEYMVPA